MSLKYEITKLGIANMNNTNNSSVRQMRSNCKRFSEWACTEGYNKVEKIKKTGERKIIQEYCDSLCARNLSPATIHTYLAAPCKALGVPMNEIEKPKRVSDRITRSRDTSRNMQGRKEMFDSKYQRLITLQSVVGIRRSELERLKGKNLTVDESGKVCVEVVRGKGGKYQLQRVLPDDIETVRAIFRGIGENEYLFSSTELRNKLDLHGLRAKNAQRAYAYYSSLNYSEKKSLVKEMKNRWLACHPQENMNSPRYIQWKEQLIKNGGAYILRGANYDRAMSLNKSVRYDRIALMAVSMFHLSHFRLGVAVVNYML